MMCTSPLVIKGDKGYFTVPCGQCIACRVNKNSDWATRIYAESRLYDDNIFLTLTYDDEHLPKDFSVHIDELQKFLKRFRRCIEPDKIRYFGVGEYGGQFMRPHYHLALFNVSGFDKRVFSHHMYDPKSKGWYCKCKAWDKGLVHFGFVTLQSSQYISGYVLKAITGEKGKEYYFKLGIEPPFAIMSRKPGLGQAFIDKYSDELKKQEYLVIMGKKRPLPRFFQNKLGIKDTMSHIMKKEQQHQDYLDEVLQMTLEEYFFEKPKKVREERLQRSRNNEMRYK